jgi:hypothetical protein
MHAPIGTWRNIERQVLNAQVWLAGSMISELTVFNVPPKMAAKAAWGKL